MTASDPILWRSTSVRHWWPSSRVSGVLISGLGMFVISQALVTTVLFGAELSPQTPGNLWWEYVVMAFLIAIFGVGFCRHAFGDLRDLRRRHFWVTSGRFWADLPGQSGPAWVSLGPSTELTPLTRGGYAIGCPVSRWLTSPLDRPTAPGRAYHLAFIAQNTDELRSVLRGQGVSELQLSAVANAEAEGFA